jgi:hypothetical protein
MWYAVFKILIHVNYQVGGIYLFRGSDSSGTQAADWTPLVYSKTDAFQTASQSGSV